MNKTFYQAFYPEGIYIVPEKKIDLGAVTLNQNVEETSEAIVKEIEQEEKIKFVGENHQKILILVEDETSDSINERDKEFLGKILGAMKLTYNDVALVNFSQFPLVTFSALESNIPFTKLILFGDNLKSIFKDKKISKYKLSEEDNVEILYSDSLLEIQEDKMKKVKLWEELKKMIVS